MSRLRKAFTQDGTTLLEYALIIAMFAVVSIASLTQVGFGIKKTVCQYAVESQDVVGYWDPVTGTCRKVPVPFAPPIF